MRFRLLSPHGLIRQTREWFAVAPRRHRDVLSRIRGPLTYRPHFVRGVTLRRARIAAAPAYHRRSRVGSATRTQIRCRDAQAKDRRRLVVCDLKLKLKLILLGGRGVPQQFSYGMEGLGASSAGTVKFHTFIIVVRVRTSHMEEVARHGGRLRCRYRSWPFTKCSPGKSSSHTSFDTGSRHRL